MPASRADLIDHYRNNPKLPVLIIGAGINGIGLFRDLALQGVDCLLIDKGDFCSGTSAAPSRLIHGGIKYLETGEFRLVAQSALERNLLLQNAPHYVRPLETIIPVYSYFGGLWSSFLRFIGRKAAFKDRGVLVLELGLSLYDFFGRQQRTMPRHSLTLRGWSLRKFPHMTRKIVATSTYYEAMVTQAERLGLETIADGQAAHRGARAINYVSVTGTANGRIELRDEIGGGTITVEPQLVVNAAGPWIDRVNAVLGINKHYIGGTKGSHLVIDNPTLFREIDGKMIYFGSSDGRICLVYPFMGKALVGSTDIRADNPDDVACDDDETSYMLAMLREVFPTIEIAPTEIVYTYSGIRPLPNQQTDEPGEISRDHSVKVDTLPGGQASVLSLIGGKWTTFRGFAEEVADDVLKGLNLRRQRSTQFEPIGGGRNFPRRRTDRMAWLTRITATHGIEQAVAVRLLERYGTGSEAMLGAGIGREDRPLKSLPSFSEKEIRYLCQHEQVGRLADILMRRTNIALSGTVTVEAAREIAILAGDELHWDQARIEQEVTDALDLLRQRHGLAHRL